MLNAVAIAIQLSRINGVIFRRLHSVMAEQLTGECGQKNCRIGSLFCLHSIVLESELELELGGPYSFAPILLPCLELDPSYLTPHVLPMHNESAVDVDCLSSHVSGSIR